MKLQFTQELHLLSLAASVELHLLAHLAVKQI